MAVLTDTNWLVFEQMPNERYPAYSCFASRYYAPWHVQAQDEDQAARTVAGVTRRVGIYAVVPATIIDLAAGDPRGTEINDLVPQGPRQP